MNYYVIRRTHPQLPKEARNYYGVSWPAGHLYQDPLGMKPLWEPREMPLTQSMIFLFRRREVAESYARMIVVHFDLTGELPRREVDPELRHHAWAWTESSMKQVTVIDLEREGLGIEEMPMQRVAELGVRTGVVFAEVVFPNENDGSFAQQSPQKYGVEQVTLPIVSKPEVFWKRHLNRSWLLPDLPDL